MTSSSKKSEFLGVPHGTANSKLRKNLLFSYVQLAGHDVCFKCNKKIESVDDFSIEHKLPWEGRSVELFWDLSNISFSHIKCNRPHVQRGGWTESGHSHLRRPSDEENIWCKSCQAMINRSLFDLDKHNYNGLYSSCKKCRSNYPSRKIHQKSL